MLVLAHQFLYFAHLVESIGAVLLLLLAVDEFVVLGGHFDAVSIADLDDQVTEPSGFLDFGVSVGFCEVVAAPEDLDHQLNRGGLDLIFLKELSANVLEDRELHFG